MPPQKLKKMGFKTLVLDLDETLVHSQYKAMLDADIVLSVDISSVPGMPMNQKIYSRKRPFCDEFLKKLAPHFEIVMFTASMERYAKPIFRKLDPHKELIDHCLYRAHCEHVDRQYFVKDLAKLGRDLSQVIIIDNSPYAYML